MKIIRYIMCSEHNHGTDENPNIVRTLAPCEILCDEAVFDLNYSLAQQEAHGEIIVETLPDPEPTAEEDTAAMLVEHEYRLTLLELGLMEA